ncbi:MULTISPECIES: hypothetical protein [unclassified Minwuia]|jgi:hypothetical protein|uniref:hypothetical protein n=1 Tax=unclassified Minwuia TaxID=2618799 RepID=UPI00247ACFD2|nr:MULTISPECIES: hypothetical protein [unclassified Minwuia]
MRVARKILFLVLLPILVAGAAHADDDRHEGYYYPGPVTSESYVGRADQIANADRGQRLGFITGLTGEQLARPYWPTFVIFAKGAEAEKMIIVATGDAGFRTIYQARALLAQLTATARGTPLFRELKVEDLFTFFDLAKMLGFNQIVISDGKSFSHRVNIE